MLIILTISPLLKIIAVDTANKETENKANQKLS